ncbi:N-acetylglucosamine kinase [Thalassotalea ganghwensis]
MLGSSNENQYFIGIDGGGSKCKAIIVDANNNVLGSGISGPANPLHGYQQAIDSITESAELALADANIAQLSLDQVIAGVGLAGVNLPVLFDKIANWQHPFKEMFLATDLLVACLGAHRGGDGAVIISGTGSCGFSYVNGQPYTIGGHGFPHGDKGSGAWFGFQAANHVLMSLDGLVESSLINEKLLALHQVNHSIELVEIIAGKPAAFYAKMANIVFDAAEAGDSVAINIVKEGAAYIDGVARQLLKQQPPRLSLIGGLTVRLIPWLAKDVQDILKQPLCPPELGSVLFAKQQLALLNAQTIN